MFVPTIAGIKHICANLLAALPQEPSSAEEVWDSGSLYIPHLSPEDYRKAVRVLPHFAQLIREWRRSLPPNVEHFLTHCLRCFYQRNFTEVECFPDVKILDESSPNKKPVFYYSKDQRRQMWADLKLYLLKEVELTREHLDLRLCASAANQVALALGRRGGVKLHFEGYYPLINPVSGYEKWQETLGTKMFDRQGRDVALEGGELFEFAQVILDTEAP